MAEIVLVCAFLFYPNSEDGINETSRNSRVYNIKLIFKSLRFSEQNFKRNQTSVLVSFKFNLLLARPNAFVLHHGVSRAEFSLTEPIPLQAVYDDHSRNYSMACLGHEHMAIDSKNSSALVVGFFKEDFRPVVS